MIARAVVSRQRSSRSGFTLVELLITITIIGMMAGMMLFALYSAQETAKQQKTRALIAKLDNIIKAKYESYRTRRLPISVQDVSPSDPPPNPVLANKQRLAALRELMRLELPDRWSDVLDPPITPAFPNNSMKSGILMPRPSVSQAFFRRANAAPMRDNQFESAECLYFIVTAALAEEADSSDAFRPDSIADKDGDGCPEFVDAWGTPIHFLRWAPGFGSDLQVADPVNAHDPFDPLKTDSNAYALFPLIFSAGPDQITDISETFDSSYSYSNSAIKNNPFFFVSNPSYCAAGSAFGKPLDNDNGNGTGNGVQNWHDNIHNHLFGRR